MKGAGTVGLVGNSFNLGIWVFRYFNNYPGQQYT